MNKYDLMKRRFLKVRDALLEVQDEHRHAYRLCYSKSLWFYADKTPKQAIKALIAEEKAYLNA